MTIIKAWTTLTLFANVVKRVVILIPVVFVFGIVAIDWVTFVFVFQSKFYDQRPFTTVAAVVLFTIVSILVLASYIRCVMTSNSPKYNPAPGHFEAAECPRCAKCLSLKPDRAHHCSMCGVCCLKMDHHCPWVANCVGHYNYKYFLLFLFWSCTGCIIYILCNWTEIMSVFAVSAKKNFTLDLMSLFGVISCIAFSITLIFFLGFHLHLVLLNQTTLEYGFIRPSSNPYDQGKRRNFESIFGTKKLFWLLPVNTLEISGWDFTMGNEVLPMSAGRAPVEFPGDNV
uniref:Palmitoyltransferase n=1 Tax=Spongospora subterranea TaxID=70186 RepID=A0A0H5RAL2_9EUKA|eukprot:CRZ11108.1 hypothetical protein [Spongospora subterranea]